MGLEGVAGDALGMRLVQKVVARHWEDPGSCVHLDHAALVAQRDQECAH